MVNKPLLFESLKFYCIFQRDMGPASLAQFDAHQTGDQEVAGSTPPWFGNILSWRFDHDILSMVILSLELIQAVVSFW